MFRRVLTAVLILAVGVVLLLVAWPQLLGLQRETGVAQVASMRGLLTALAVLVAVLLALAAFLSTTLRQVAGAIALLLVVFAGIQLAVLSTRGAGDGAFESKEGGDVTVLSWNTFILIRSTSI